MYHYVESLNCLIGVPEVFVQYYFFFQNTKIQIKFTALTLSVINETNCPEKTL